MKNILQHIFCLCFILLLLYTSVSCQALDYPGDKKKPPGPNETIQGQEANNDYEGMEKDGYGAGTEEIIPEGEKEAQEEHPEIISRELLEHKPNELGEVMILMYHEIGYPEAAWRRTPENFRRDLEILYEQGYRTVSLTDLVRGNINIPAGTSPVVLTFDDGNKGNFYYRENSSELEPAPDCAVAIMESFYREKPDFGLAATFFIYYPNPFRASQYIEKKLNYLVSKGFEIGNHTYGHANLSQLHSGEIQRELAQHVQKTREYVAGYEVSSLALPYGGYPKENSELLVQGSYGGITYKNEAVLLVGSNPSTSPFHKKFNSSRLPRIRASEMETDGVGLYDWLEYFQQNPHKRYISDGDSRYVTAPDSWSDFLNESGLGDREARFYVN
jgi:peptidoglycan/xylan/chitin deacetylase (PgdA/CDA1 family)